MSLLEAISHQVAVTPSALAPMDLVELGCVYVNNERNSEPAAKIRAGDLMRLHTQPRRFQIPTDLNDRIVNETQDYIVVEKPAGLPTDGVVDNQSENLVSALEDLRGVLFPVFDLEIESAGLVVLAKSEKSREVFSQAFKVGNVLRTYVAFTENPISDLGPKVRLISCRELPARTDVISEGRNSWAVVENPFSKFYRLEIEQMQGRPSEIREILAQLGAPVIGDQRRGSKTVLKDMATGKLSPAFCTIAISFPFC